MKILDKIKSWIGTLSSPTIVDVQEVNEKCGETLSHIARHAGIKTRELEKVNAIALFEEWYGGSCDEESVHKSLPAFLEAHPTVKPKLQGLL